MPTPPKPVKVIELEGKSHRTKRELRQRRQAEESLLTGKSLKESFEVKSNEKAHKEFLRIQKLLNAIGKDDDLYGSTINRYCLILAECSDFEDKRELIFRQQEKLEDHESEMEFPDYIKQQSELSKILMSYDRQIQAKRKMLLDIEKENIMTIAAALRGIPKNADEKKNPLKEILSG